MSTVPNEDLEAMVEAAYTRMRERTAGGESPWESDDPFVRQALKQQILDIVHLATKVLPELGWVKQRTITTVEGLEALRDGSCLMDDTHFFFSKRPDDEGDTTYAYEGDNTYYEARNIAFPAVVLYEPEPTR